MASHAPKVDIGSKLMFVVSAVALLAVVYILGNSLVNTFTKNSLKGEIDTSQKILTVEKNLRPIGTAATSDAPVAGVTSRAGKEIYEAVCTSCHATGVLDSPKLGDKAAWETRATSGLNAILTSAKDGKGSMPAKGGDPSLTDAELKAVVLYMLKETGLDLAGDENAKAPAEKEAVVETSKKSEAPVAATAPASASLEDGKKVYDTACFACHSTGIADSPKLGDKEAWASRIATGIDTLYTTALKGKGAMPAKGGNASLDDVKVKAAVDYMVSQVQ